MDYDDTNKGAAFKPFDKQKLILSGKLNNNGEDHDIVLVSNESRNGEKLIGIYTRVGTLFTNDKKGNESAPDYTGPLGERRIAGWKKTSEGGAPFLSLSVSDKFRNEQIDDDIPPF
jgi:hypothetical protein